VYATRRLESFVLPVLGPRRFGIQLGQRETPQKSFEPRPRVAACSLSLLFPGSLMTKIYVGNLSFDTTEDSLRTLFAQHGAVESAKLMSDRDTGRPRGFAFVEMSNSDAPKAIQSLNGKDFEGRTLRVSEAQAQNRPERSAGGARRY
jgi:RNA recognition motif-containing protein